MPRIWCRKPARFWKAWGSRQIVGAHLAVPDRHQHLPDRAGGRQRRPLPTGLGAPSSDPTGEIVERAEVPWLEPLPDPHDDATDPATIAGSHESVRLAFVAALQHLSPRQRAVLVLRDVLRRKAAEVGAAIGVDGRGEQRCCSEAQLDAVGPSEDDQLAAPDSPKAQDLLARYIAAFEAYDIDTLVKLFTDEAICECRRRRLVPGA